MEKKIESQNSIEQIPEIQKKPSISFFSVSIKKNQDLRSSLEIIKIFGKELLLAKIFDIKHKFISKDDKFIIKGLNGIEFEFTTIPLTGKSEISLITLEVLNLGNNLTRIERHYLQSVFYNLKESGFNIKYLDDNFSDLTKKDYIIGHECKVGDVCDLITSFKDNFKLDDEKIKQNLELLRNGEGDFEELKKEIVSKEISNLLNFRLSLEHLIFTRNEILKKNKNNIDDLVLQNALKSSVLVGNYFDEDKIFEIEKDLTDGVLIGSFSILKMLEGKLIELLDFFKKIDKIEDNKIKVELIEKVVKTSNDIFLQSEVIARKTGILSLLNPKNWFGRKTRQLEIQEPKKLTKQEEIDEAMDIMVELLNYINGNDKKEDSQLKELQEKYPDNSILNTLKRVHGKYEGALGLGKKEINLLEKKYGKDFEKQFSNNFYIGANFPYKWISFKFSNYSDLEQIFEKYEEFLKILYLNDYAFEKSKYTNDYQKILYIKGEFYFDEGVNFENFVKDFFKKIVPSFNLASDPTHNKLLNKKYGHNKCELVEVNKKIIWQSSTINHLFNIKIGENIFPVRIINPLGDDINKIITIGTTFENDSYALNEFLKFAETLTITYLQKKIKNKIDNILLMNFDLSDSNIYNKIAIVKNLQKINGEKISLIDRTNTLMNFDVNQRYKVNLNYGQGFLETKKKSIHRHNSEGIMYKPDFIEITEKQFISEIGIKPLYVTNLEIAGKQGIYYFGGKVLNKYIVDYLVYGEKPKYSEKNRVMYKEIGGIERTEGNPQYEEYLEFIHSYEENFY